MQPDGTTEVLAHFLGARVQPGEFVDWAVQALIDGFDGPALRTLAGLDLDAPRREVRQVLGHDLFQKALEELEIKLPSLDDALRAYVVQLASCICGGKREPLSGLETIKVYVLDVLSWTPGDGPPSELWLELVPWDFLSENLEYPSRRWIEGEEWMQAIRAEACRWAAMGD